MSSPKKALTKNIYLTIVNYIGGQIDNELKPTVVLNSDQFLFAYNEDDKGFIFDEYNTTYSTKFDLANIKKTIGLKHDVSLDEVIDALYSLEDYGFEDTENMPGVIRFIKRLTGETDLRSNKVDPRGSVFA